MQYPRLPAQFSQNPIKEALERWFIQCINPKELDGHGFPNDTKLSIFKVL